MIATKPQTLDKVLAGLGSGSPVIVSIVGDAPVGLVEKQFGASTPVVGVMPNLPTSVGAGVSALYGNPAANDKALALISALSKAVGVTMTLPAEDMLHLVTGLSGSPRRSAIRRCARHYRRTGRQRRSVRLPGLRREDPPQFA